MKVAEKATDRGAEVHMYVEGKLQALEEYGQYISVEDHAICCYVPVDEGHKIKIGAKFSGTTLTIAYDAVVDGVFRKANFYAARTVHIQKKKIDVESFLCKTDKGIIDTQMLVAPISARITSQGGPQAETIGTLELRLYITRQLNVFHSVESAETYYAPTGILEDVTQQTASYKQIAPTFQMEFEQNCAPLGKLKSTREQRNMNAPRPGTEPWAIFRFHYRSKDAIIEKNLKLTFDPLSKEKTNPHTLLIDPVPPLLAGTKPHKDDGDSSTRASSPIPPDLPLTPVKGTLKKSALKSTTPVPTTTPTTEKEPSTSPDSSPSPEMTDSMNEIRARVFSTKEMFATEAKKSTSNGRSDGVISSSTVSNHDEKALETSKDTTTYDKTTEIVSKKAAGSAKIASTLFDKAVEKEAVTDNDTIPVALPKDNPIKSIEESVTKASSLTNTGAKLIDGTTARRTSEDPNTPWKKLVVKPAPILKTMPVSQNRPPTPVTPAKRPATLANGASHELKRMKTAPSTVSRISPGSSSPKPLSIERQFAEQRKKIETLRRKRKEIAKKQSAVDKQMEPYKERMAEKLERLNQEMMEEEKAYTEEEQHYSASVEVLKEFNKLDGGL
ncbi:uncharacterized protein K460DRAFT_355525 [Cucurbitaria berberidis CBS 394.84]|uniref:Uncharacterized protein n=1 Tax=Cucurbitaria berberidis CBS 394.84 TaxID=1168544 RepID=A0A9P4L870_9PLEO|nr:uncharacterized protein K460DRAFT_355525 [Cucurbitaria berberidis CBS 394.84]KAF1845751.1 hypothetical protein K460DRAFT_355525 [Cucurbitaria berberidis CBS 394.84]